MRLAAPFAVWKTGLSEGSAIAANLLACAANSASLLATNAARAWKWVRYLAWNPAASARCPRASFAHAPARRCVPPIFVDDSGTMSGYVPAGFAGLGASGSSRMRWQLEPPSPNELTPM